jgi:acetyltransferase
VAFPREAIVPSVEDALSAAGKIGYPVVVKTARPGLLHRTEAGGVVVGVAGPAELRAACRGLAERLGGGPLLVQEEVAGGVELLVGGRRDPSFGPVVLCGAGGVLAELIGEASLRLLPIGPDDAVAMLREGRKATLLGGFRGAPPCDEAALVAVLTGVGDLLVDHPEIEELDVNPLIATAGRAVAVDALIIVNTPERRASHAT